MAKIYLSWLKEGDKNTIFFHRMASLRSKVNFVGNGRVLEDPHESKDEVACFLEDSYTREFGARPNLDGISFPMMS